MAIQNGMNNVQCTRAFVLHLLIISTVIRNYNKGNVYLNTLYVQNADVNTFNGKKNFKIIIHNKIYLTLGFAKFTSTGKSH